MFDMLGSLSEAVITVLIGAILGWAGERFGKISDRLHRVFMIAINATAHMRVTVQFADVGDAASLPRAIYGAYATDASESLDLMATGDHRWTFATGTTIHDLRRIDATSWSYEQRDKVPVRKAVAFGADWLRRIDISDAVPPIRNVQIALDLPYRRARVVIPGSRKLEVRRFEVSLAGKGSEVEVELVSGTELRASSGHFHELRRAIQSAL